MARGLDGVSVLIFNLKLIIEIQNFEKEGACELHFEAARNKAF